MPTPHKYNEVTLPISDAIISLSTILNYINYYFKLIIYLSISHNMIIMHSLNRLGFGRNSNHNIFWCNICIYYSGCSNNRSISNCHSWQNHRSRPYPHIIPNTNLFPGQCFSITFHIFLMRFACNTYACSNHGIIASSLSRPFPISRFSLVTYYPPIPCPRKPDPPQNKQRSLITL